MSAAVEVTRVPFVLMLMLGVAACTKQPPAPAAPVVDRQEARDASVDLLRDASVDLLRDAAGDGPRDAQPDGAAGAPGRRRPHRAAEPHPTPPGGLKVTGAIARTDVETVLRGARGQLTACFQKARAQAPDLHGLVTFRLSIDGRGRVPLAEVVTSTLGGGDPELCMVEALRDLKFPPSASGGDSTLTFPMAFRN
ncbi:MAG TPA: AgmX/PglI C-terminal domain-containing protein [Polyangia bacterium]|nr:AgmX/PglI C-terminal domain-containing protein [Polyangia bacterium]